MTAVNAAAAALPVKIEQGNVVLDLNHSTIQDLNLPKLKINDPELEKGLREFLRSGGMFVSSLEERAAGLASLLTLDDPNLKKVLEEEFQNIARIAPPEVLSQVAKIQSEVTQQKVTVDEVRKRLETSRDELKKLLQAGNGAERRKLLAQILGNGMVLVTNSENRVVAVARDINREVAQINERREQLQSFATQEFDRLINVIVREIQGKQSEIQKEAEAAKEDVGRLRSLADRISKPSGDIEQVRGLLGKLKGELMQAQSKFDDAKLASEAAQSDEAAARYRTFEQRYLTEASKLKLDRSILDTDYAVEQVARDQALYQQRLLQELAQQERVEQAELALQSAYDDCIDHGVDPARPEETVSDRILLHRSLSRGRNPADGSQLYSLSRMRGAFGGLLRWMALLNLKTTKNENGNLEDRSADGWLRLLVSESEICVSRAECRTQGNRILSWAKLIEGEFNEQASRIAYFDMRKKTLTMKDSRISVGRELVSPDALALMYGKKNMGASAFEIDPWEDRRWEGFPHTVVAAFDIGVGENMLIDNCPSLDVFNEGQVEKALMVASRIVVLKGDENTVNTDEISYHLVSPSGYQVYADGPIVPAHVDFGTSQSLKSVAEDLLKEELKKEFFPWQEPLRFSGHRGTWTVYLTHTRLKKNMSNEERKAIVSKYANLEIKVMFPLLYLKR